MIQKNILYFFHFVCAAPTDVKNVNIKLVRELMEN